MITGYNTDIRHGSRVFHVQTEDNGVSNPSVVTLIYVGGEILASKKTSYADQVPLDEKRISELMENQHRRMIAAIKKGRFDGPTLPADPLADDDDTDVSRAAPMISTAAVSRRTGVVPGPTATAPTLDPSVRSAPSTGPMRPPAPTGAAVPAPAPPARSTIAPPAGTPQKPPPPVAPLPPSAARAAAPSIQTKPAIPSPPPKKEGGPIAVSDRSLDEVIRDYLATASTQEHLELSLVTTGDLISGDSVELRVLARTSVTQEPIVGAEVIFKIISTIDKPVLAHRGKTTGDGSCIARFKIPDYTEGNAALIVTASSPHGNDEVKQLIKRRK
jgi:hypothetical protein